MCDVSEAKVKVTLLSGFLGAGKTSLMKHVLSNREGVRCAVIVNEISELNPDADILAGTKLIQSDDQLVEMGNGCICCTLREDLLNQLRELSLSGKYDCVLIESSGIAEPMQVAETFFVETEAGVLQSICALDNCVTVVDASTFEEYMGRIDTISSIDAAATPDEDKEIASLLLQQIEFANVVVLNKVDLIPEAEREATVKKLTAFVKTLAPSALVLPTSQSKVAMPQILNTGHFTLDFANGQKDWMEDIKSGIKHVPETLEYGVSSMMFRSDVPFHPKRLHAWITKHFLLSQMEIVPGTQGEGDADAVKDAPDAAVDENKREPQAEPAAPTNNYRELLAQKSTVAAERKAARIARYGNLFRSKGHLCVGSPGRMPMFGIWSQAGTILGLNGGSTWDMIPKPRGEDTVPYQLLAFVGQDLNADVLKADLEALLLTPEEMQQLRTHMGEHGPNGDLFDDPFEPWFLMRPADDDDEEEEENGEQEKADE